MPSPSTTPLTSALLPHNAHPCRRTPTRHGRQIIGLAVEQGQAMLVASNYYDHRIYGQFADRCFAAGIFPTMAWDRHHDQDIGAAGVRRMTGSSRICLCGVATRIVDRPRPRRGAPPDPRGR